MVDWALRRATCPPPLKDTHSASNSSEIWNSPHSEFLWAVLGRLVDETLEPSMSRFDLSGHVSELVTTVRISVVLENQCVDLPNNRVIAKLSTESFTLAGILDALF